MKRSETKSLAKSINCLLFLPSIRDEKNQKFNNLIESIIKRIKLSIELDLAFGESCQDKPFWEMMIHQTLKLVENVFEFRNLLSDSVIDDLIRRVLLFHLKKRLSDQDSLVMQSVRNKLEKLFASRPDNNKFTTVYKTDWLSSELASLLFS